MNETTDPTDPTDQQIYDYILPRIEIGNLICLFPDIRSKFEPALWDRIHDTIDMNISNQLATMALTIQIALRHPGCTIAGHFGSRGGGLTVKES
jgi:hypothetical protein